MGTSIRDTMFTWSQQEKMMEDLALDHVQRGRGERIMATAKAIATELAEATEAAMQNPHLNRDGVRAAIESAQAKAREKMGPVTATLEALRRDVAANAEPPATSAKVDPETVAAIRSRLAEMDPLEVLALYTGAAADNDVATLAAIDGCHPVAYPAVGKMFQANPGIRDRAAQAARFQDPAARRFVDGASELSESLGAVVADLERAVGAPDEIAKLAAGE